MVSGRRRFVPFLALLLLVAGCAPPLQPVSPSPLSPMIREPAPAAAFVDAFAHGDETAAERVASPLYRAEWDRRGITPAERFGWHAQASPSATAGEWLRLRYIGGITGASGQHHLLYVGQSGLSRDGSAQSVWRFDTEPDGRVIWGELVYLFSDSTEATAVVRSPGEGPALARTALAAYHPLVVVGVEGGATHEGYYALVRPEPDRPAQRDGTPAISVAFFAIDSDGYIRPGVWTYQS